MTNGYNTPIGVPIGLPSILSLGLPPLVNPYPTLNLDFIQNPQFDSRITFSRGSQATLFDSTGTLRYAKHNLLTRSDDFADAAWTKSASSITSNTTVAPDGTLTGDKLVEDLTNASHFTRQNHTSTVGLTYVSSVYLKAAERTSAVVIHYDGSLFYGVSVNLLTGVLSTPPADLSLTDASATSTVVSVGNGWYRVTVTRPQVSTTTTQTRVALQNGSNGSYTGDGTSGLFLWGAQLNLSNMEGGVTSSLTTYYPTTTAAYYAPRFDYNPSTLQPRGLLIEEQRTNLFPASNDFSNATYWTVYGTAVATGSAAVGPDGLTSASNLAGATDTTLSGNNLEESVSISASTAYTFSVFVKSNGGTEVVLRLRDSTGGSTSSVTLAVTSAWQRVSLTRTMAVGATSVRCIIGQTNGNILIYGAQLEAGAFATSYIPTTTTALTRNADVATMTGTNFSSWYNQTEGSLFAEYAIPFDSSASVFPVIVGVSDGTFNNVIINYARTVDDTRRATVRVSGAVQFDVSNGVAYTYGTTSKQILAYATNNAALSVVGTAPATVASTSIPTVNQMGFGNTSFTGGALQPLNGWLRRVAYYPTRLPNTTLQALTA